MVETLREFAPPDMTRMLDALKQDILTNLNCVRPGIIQQFDPVTQTAAVLVAQKQVVDVAPDGTRTLADYPLIFECPVVFQRGGGFVGTFPVNEGDQCVILFCDREIDNWLYSGPAQAPSSPRLHDMSDAICIVGLSNLTDPIPNFSNDAAQLRTLDGQTLVSVSATEIRLEADSIVIAARQKATIGANGTGIKYEPNLVTTRMDGVPTAHSNPTPPEVA